MANKKYSQELKATVLELYDEGNTTYKQLEKEFELGSGMVSYWIRTREKKELEQKQAEEKERKARRKEELVAKKEEIEYSSLQAVERLTVALETSVAEVATVKAENENLKISLKEAKGKLLDHANAKAKAIYDYEEMKAFYDEVKDENNILKIKLDEAEKFAVPEVIDQPTESLIHEQQEEIAFLKKAFKYFAKG